MGEPLFRCEICRAAIADRENMVALSLYKVRLRPRSKRKSILFQEEFPNGTHELHFHEACLFRNVDRVFLELYDDELPPEPRLNRSRKN